METMGYGSFQAFERREYIHIDDLPFLTDYICGNLNSDYSPNRDYYYEQYNYVNKLQIVCIWKQRQGLLAAVCNGEAICNDQFVNFSKDQEYKNCICSVLWFNTFSLIKK